MSVSKDPSPCVLLLRNVAVGPVAKGRSLRVLLPRDRSLCLLWPRAGRRVHTVAMDWLLCVAKEQPLCVVLEGLVPVCSFCLSFDCLSTCLSAPPVPVYLPIV